VLNQSQEIYVDTIQQLEAFDAYIQALGVHDWQYDHSDDHRVWKAGLAASAKLQASMKTNPILARAYWAYVQWAHGDEPIGGNTALRDSLVLAARTELAIAATTNLISA
jgi:hypothetical protein